METWPLSKVGELGSQYGLDVLRVSGDEDAIGRGNFEFHDVLIAVESRVEV